jgi:hypothetical protein
MENPREDNCAFAEIARLIFWQGNYRGTDWHKEYTASRLFEIANLLSRETRTPVSHMFSAFEEELGKKKQLAEFICQACSLGEDADYYDDDDGIVPNEDEFEAMIREAISWFEETGCMEFDAMVWLVDFHREFILARMEWSI